MPELNGAPATPAELQALALVNYGHYTSMRVDDGAVRGLTHHLTRLTHDSQTVFGVDLDRDVVLDHIRHAAAQHDGSFNIRVTVFDPDLQLSHPGNPAKPSVLVTTRPTATLPAPPLSIGSARYERDLPAVKHVGLFGALAHRRGVQLRGFDDAVFVDREDHVSEGATWNIGFFDGTSVIWPAAAVLTGVTMRLLQQVHDETVVRPVDHAELGDLQAAFATNTTVGVRPISAVDGVEFRSDHSIIRALQDEYAEIPPEPLFHST